MRFIKVNEIIYKQVRKTSVNVDNILYVQEISDPRDANSRIVFKHGEIEVLETMEQLETMIYGTAEDILKQTMESVKKWQNYLSQNRS